MKQTDANIKIDGVLEQCWEPADIATGFSSTYPHERECSTESTLVRILQDRENIYLFVQCFLKNVELLIQTGSNEDFFVVYLDPFLSRTTSYYFRVFASGRYDDGIIRDDGRTSDDTWDGVWSKAVKIFNDYYSIEMQIPFKAIRFNKANRQWGINFKRYIGYLKESDYWVHVTQKEGNLVSKYGVLRNVYPQSGVYNVEIYPGINLAYRKENEEKIVKASGSLDIKYDLTSTTALNITLYPDFAQIEADPFTLNLSRYPLGVAEQRPFFVEGKEIFALAKFGSGLNIYNPLEIFHSRQIGKPINNQPVPIIGGIKITSKSKQFNWGFLGAYTDSLDTESKKLFTVLRAQKKVFQSSDIGFILDVMLADKNLYNYALGFDAAYRRGFNQFALQGDVSDYSRKYGWAFNYGGKVLIHELMFMNSLSVISDSFDVSEIGYVPWIGEKKMTFLIGHYKTFSKGLLRESFIGPGVILSQESTESNHVSKIINFVINPTFINNWVLFTEFDYGTKHEMNTEYAYKEAKTSVWVDGVRYSANIYNLINYTYNYYRNYLAYQNSVSLFIKYSITNKFSVSLSLHKWIEWDTLGYICNVTSTVTPRIEYKITKDIMLNFFNEFVYADHDILSLPQDFLSSRVGLLISWNYSPKSWIYLTANANTDDQFLKKIFQKQIVIIKLKHLFNF